MGMRIDVWSDILCPFCHLGRRHLELALADFPQRDEIDVVWHSFELDHGAEAMTQVPNIERVADKYGMSVEQAHSQHEQMARTAAEVGLDFRWDLARGGNSFDAHRVIHFARAQGLEEAVTARIMRAWYTEGEAIDDHATLIRLGVEAGLDEAEVSALLDGDDCGFQVREDEALAAEIGISSVPTFVLDQKYAVVGAQPVPVLRNAIAQVWELQGTEPEPAGAGGCGCGGCGCGAG